MNTPPAFDPAATSRLRALDGALLRGVGVISVFAALTGVARVGQDASIAWRFGTGPVVDAYYFLVNLVNWPIAVALSVLTMLAAPTDVALRGGQAGSARRFRAELLGVILILAIFSLPLAWWALHAISAGRLGGLEPVTAANAIAGVAGIAAAIPLGLIGALLSAWFVATSRRVLTLLEMIPPLALTALILLVPGSVLFWGTSVGIAIQVLAMILVLARAGEIPPPRVGLSDPAWHRFSRGAVVLLAGQALFSLVPLVDAFFAIRLGDGVVATLSFANRLVAGLLGLAGLALQRAGLPLLSGLATQSAEVAQRVALRWASVAAMAGALIAMLTWLLANPMVSMLFERGSFTGPDREQVVTLLRFGLFQLPAVLAGMALAAALASLRESFPLMLAAAAGLGVKLLLGFVLSRWLGAVGLQLSTLAMYLITALICFLALRNSLTRKVR